MISLPDFKEKQVLFVEARYGVENSLKFQNDNILYRKDGKNINRISCFKVFAVFLIGNFTLSNILIKQCKKYGISLFLLSDNFETYAEIGSGLESNFILRDRQYKFENDLAIAKKLVENKISNQLYLLKESNPNFDLEKELFSAKEKLKNSIEEKEILGIEGNFSKNFFSEYFKRIHWLRRMPRTKYDINNVLLDIGYTFLFNFVDSLLRLYGFDTYKGFYHKLFFQRKSLSCDIMEPFRCIIDRQLLKSNNLGQIKKQDFEYKHGKFQITFENRQKYAGIFLETIMSHKEYIFSYVKNFYRFFMIKGQEFPLFNIKK